MSVKRFFKYPWLIVGIIGVITVFFALQLPRAQLDNNNFRFVPENDPERIRLAKIDDTFGSQVFIMVGLERRYDTVLDSQFLQALRTYSQELEKLPLVDSTQSIISSDYISGSNDTITVEPLLPENFTGSTEELTVLKERLLSWDLYERSLISDDLKSTQILITLNVTAEEAGSEEVVHTYRTIKNLTYSVGFPETNIYFAGIPVLSVEINDAILIDLRFLVPLVTVVVLVVLFLSFRRSGGVILPMLTVLISTIWAMGAMPLFGVRLSILSAVLPVILVAVGSAYGIHLVNYYYDEIANQKNLAQEEFRERIFAMFHRVGYPVLLAALTTFAGFISCCFTTVVPIFEFGIFSSLGVLSALIVAVTLIPSLYLIRGPVSTKADQSTNDLPAANSPIKEDRISIALATELEKLSHKKKTVLGVAVILVFFSCIGLSKLVVDNVLVEYFKPTTDVARADQFIREHFGGSKEVSIVISSPTPGRVLHPDVLGAMDGLSTYLTESVPEVGKVTGFADLVKRVNQVFNVDAPPEGLIPLATSSTGTETFDENAQFSTFGFGAIGVDQSDATGKDLPSFAFESTGIPTQTEQDVTKTNAPNDSTLDLQSLSELVSKAFTDAAGKTMSVEQFTKALYRRTNYQGYAYYEIPTEPERYGKQTKEELKSLISNYLVFLSGDISMYADDPLEPKAIRSIILLKTTGQIDTNRAINAINAYCKSHFPEDIQIEIGGTSLVEESLNKLVVQSQLISIFASILLVALILSVYYQSIIAGIIALIPLGVSVLLNFGIMAFAGIKLNIATALVASVSVGIGIDYTIHYLAAYHHEWLKTQGQGNFLWKTFYSSGKAIIYNAASVGAGFAVLMLSQFVILKDLGMLYALTMVTSALAALTVLPVLLQIIQPRFITRPLRWDNGGTL